VTSQDWAEIPASRIAANVLNTVQPGSIILLHDSGNLFSPEGGNRINTVRALPLIIQGLRERGYTIIALDDLILLAGLTGEEQEEVPHGHHQILP
jgi:peptidoglycan/xylan/chitin deacetylase (PgdA/CDA1 family)